MFYSVFGPIFRLVVDEYEKTISEVLSEREREKLLHDIEIEKISNQRNQVIYSSYNFRISMFPS